LVRVHRNVIPAVRENVKLAACRSLLEAIWRSHSPGFPPAPASGPASVLSLPPDDWVMQPKIDGIRVIYRGEPFTRLGEPLSNCKGAATLRAMFRGFIQTLDGEWCRGKATTRSTCRTSLATLTAASGFSSISALSRFLG